MNVPSWQFLAFALAGAATFNVGSASWWRTSIWLVMNLVFVWSLCGALPPLLTLAGFLAIGYGCLMAAGSGRKPLVHASIPLLFATFVWIKRYSFVPESLLLPGYVATVGFSYIFFRLMHLVIDASQSPTERLKIVPFLNYVLNFPAFVSGPIQRLEDYAENSSLSLTVFDVGNAFWRIILGSFKVMVLSVSLHAIQTEALTEMTSGAPSWTSVLYGSVTLASYPLFLYANFSGYTDVVIGVARLFRLRLPENFDRPFGSPNFIEFWNRWHISLSQWLRSYVFSPLLLTWMRRHKTARSKQYPGLMALFVTFFLVGAWHGQTSEFLFFGVLQGSGVATNRLYQIIMSKRLTPSVYSILGANPLYRAVTRGLTFTWFAFTLLWFWTTWHDIASLAMRLGWSGSFLVVTGTAFGAGTILALPELLGASMIRLGNIHKSRYTRTALAGAMITVILATWLITNQTSPEIVYKYF